MLLYHDVCASEAERNETANPRFTTPLPKLRAHLEILREQGYRTLGLEDWLATRETAEGPSENPVAILTFDGPHEGWFQHAIPLLRETGTPAAFFITAGWIGAKHPYPESRNFS